MSMEIPRPTHHIRRRRTSGSFRVGGVKPSCYSLPPSLEALDLPTLSSNTPAATLVSLRIQVLSYLDDLETRLTSFASPPESDASEDDGDDPACGAGSTSTAELALDEVAQWARDGLQMLQDIREDVRAFLPSFTMVDDVTASLDGVKVRIPDLADVHIPDMTDVRARLPDMPDVMSHLPDFDFDVRGRISAAKTAWSDLDFRSPASYLPKLSNRLRNLQAHLSSMASSSSVDYAMLAPSVLMSDLLDRLSTSDIVRTMNSEPAEEDSVLERAAKDLTKAVKRSMHGAKLIAYHDLPHAWQNNPFVTSGYRFIPLERWPLIILSLFALHNETLNIHTHLVPFFTWVFKSMPFLNTAASTYDWPERAFIAFACICLLSSAIWHTMSGCAHRQGMEFCARVDYVGIGWLISASVGTVVYYGFQGHEFARNLYVSLCFLMGLAGSICPFMSWFNMREYKLWRVAFFLFLAFTSLAPLAHLTYLYSFMRMWAFISPIVPSLRSYLIGLAFYVSHFPECYLVKPGTAGKWARRLDQLGGGSHAIWHLWIVLAIYQHKTGMRQMKAGFA